ncbi:hypothetical protein GCM10027275_16400 [Rhabdobacter roseus]|uniref:Uncharacterized protein n=1 Tax=Rhabdobacter roseus TaxID=1655419 RepID=A0A840TJH5_9BACT|nr:hypothetical protein [Rhabdobacter roseus]MBB5283561.1 hypothetical protein [Rhabdobacter roseus]
MIAFILQYTENGRSGTITFSSPETTFDMWYEFAASPALVIIGIPTPQHWEAQTKTPLPTRAALLDQIAKQVIKDKVGSNGYHHVDDHTITIFTGKNPR